MKVLLCGDFEPGEREQWLEALAAVLPQARWLDLDDARADAAAVHAAVVANPLPGSLAGLPSLRFVQSVWAGVDRLLADPTLPAGIPVARMVDPLMTAAMAETALWAVLSLHRGYFVYADRQRHGLWQAHAQQRAGEVPVLVLGLGAMGSAVASRLSAQGYPVRGWRRADGDLALRRALPHTRIVVNLLPLTPATRGLLDANFFAALPTGASIVNLGRGAHIVDADLLAALDRGHVRHAVLDVFHVEPLPAVHPYWTHRAVTMLPHAAAMTDVQSAAAVVADNLRRFERSEALLNLVDRARGY